MKCQKCGKALPDTVRFCAYCGTPAPQPSQGPVAVQPPRSRLPGWRRYTWVLLPVFLALLGVAYVLARNALVAGPSATPPSQPSEASPTPSPYQPAPPPWLASPEDGATEVPTEVTLAWNPLATAACYHVQVAYDPGFTREAADQYSYESYASVSGLQSEVKYWWRVRAVDYAGQRSDWSTAWDFTTRGLQPQPQTPSSASSSANAADITPAALAPRTPTPPAPSLPEAWAASLPTAVTLTWTGCDDAAFCQVELARDPGFSDVLWWKRVSGTSARIEGLEGDTEYWWRLKAVGYSGAASDWSPARCFTTRGL